jgi:hypothetical protein
LLLRKEEAVGPCVQPGLLGAGWKPSSSHVLLSWGSGKVSEGYLGKVVSTVPRKLRPETSGDKTALGSAFVLWSPLAFVLVLKKREKAMKPCNLLFTYHLREQQILYKFHLSSQSKLIS